MLEIEPLNLKYKVLTPKFSGGVFKTFADKELLQ